jgi:hypothetical protein
MLYLFCVNLASDNKIKMLASEAKKVLLIRYCAWGVEVASVQTSKTDKWIAGGWYNITRLCCYATLKSSFSRTHLLFFFPTQFLKKYFLTYFTI